MAWLPTTVKQHVRTALRKAGYEIIPRIELTAERRAVLLANRRIQTVIDVGGNRGQFGLELRRHGFHGRIISFEPTTEAFFKLERAAHRDGNWLALPFALGAESGIAEIHLTSNGGASSSLLDMLDAHREGAPHVSVCGKETITIKTLDEALDGLVAAAEPLLLKIDTQGYEPMVLLGAPTRLRQVQVLQCELSLIPLYAGQSLFWEMLEIIDGLGFVPTDFSSAFTFPDEGYCLQLDGVFVRRRADQTYHAKDRILAANAFACAAASSSTIS